MMDKDAVSGLSTSELANFPLDDFFDHYEKGLRKVSEVPTRIAVLALSPCLAQTAGACVAACVGQWF